MRSARLYLLWRSVGDLRHARAVFPQNAYRALIYIKKLHNDNHIGTFDVLQTETVLVTAENTGPLPSRSKIRQIHAESGPDRIWDHDTGTILMCPRFAIPTFEPFLPVFFFAVRK